MSRLDLVAKVSFKNCRLSRFVLIAFDFWFLSVVGRRDRKCNAKIIRYIERREVEKSETREKFTRRTESEGHAAVAVAVVGGVVPVATSFRGLESPTIFAAAHDVALSCGEGIVRRWR